MNISEDSMVRYLQGKSQFKLNQLIQLSEILRISLCCLITGKEENELTTQEQELIRAYRAAAPDMRSAAEKLLDMKQMGKLSTSSDGEEAI